MRDAWRVSRTSAAGPEMSEPRPQGQAGADLHGHIPAHDPGYKVNTAPWPLSGAAFGRYVIGSQEGRRYPPLKAEAGRGVQ